MSTHATKQPKLGFVLDHATNHAMAESVYGPHKYESRRLPGNSQWRASGLAQSRTVKSFAHVIAFRRRYQKTTTGQQKNGWRSNITTSAFCYFHCLPDTEARALIEIARTQRQQQWQMDRADQEGLDAFLATRWR